MYLGAGAPRSREREQRLARLVFGKLRGYALAMHSQGQRGHQHEQGERGDGEERSS
jgi:hypothetical protein